MALTGRFTFRRSFGGKIVLQVEEEVRRFWPSAGHRPLKRRWRDASLMDLAAPELRPLIDLRYKPQFMAQYEYLAPDAAEPAPVTAEVHDGLLPRAPLPRPVASRIGAMSDERPSTSVELDQPPARFSRTR